MTHKSAIVIGGGLGGLSCALSLKASGFDVKLYEKNTHLGGKLNTFEKDGFRFDLGPSIFTMPHIFDNLFKELGESLSDWVDLIPIDPQWKNFFADGSSFNLYQNKSKMQNELTNFSGKNSVGQWFEYLNYCHDQFNLVEKGYLNHGIDGFFDLVRFYGIRQSLFGIDWHSSMSKKIKKHVEDERLQSVLEYFIKYVGSSAINSPSMMGLLFSMQIKYGLWYLNGGLFELSKAMSKIAKKIGIKVFLGCDIAKILKANGTAIGIETRDGKKDFASKIICNQEVVVASKELLDEPHHKQLKMEKKYAPSCSGLVIHIGTKKVYPQLAHHNFFYSNDQDRHFKKVFDKHQIPDDPTLYVVAPSRTDDSVCPKGMDNIKILPHIPPLDDKSDNNVDYDKLRDVVLLKLEKMGLTDLRRNIVIEETWTPKDLKQKYRSNRGSIYGVVCDRWKNQGIKAPKKSKDVKNLYYVGGSTNPGSGMPMVVLGGHQTAKMIACE